MTLSAAAVLESSHPQYSQNMTWSAAKCCSHVCRGVRYSTNKTCCKLKFKTGCGTSTWCLHFTHTHVNTYCQQACQASLPWLTWSSSRAFVTLSQPTLKATSARFASGVGLLAAADSTLSSLATVFSAACLLSLFAAAARALRRPLMPTAAGPDVLAACRQAVRVLSGGSKVQRSLLQGGW